MKAQCKQFASPLRTAATIHSNTNASSGNTYLGNLGHIKQKRQRAALVLEVNRPCHECTVVGRRPCVSREV